MQSQGEVYLKGIEGYDEGLGAGATGALKFYFDIIPEQYQKVLQFPFTVWYNGRFYTWDAHVVNHNTFDFNTVMCGFDTRYNFQDREIRFKTCALYEYSQLDDSSIQSSDFINARHQPFTYECSSNAFLTRFYSDQYQSNDRIYSFSFFLGV